MRTKIYLPKSQEELKKLNRTRQDELWRRYVDTPYNRQFRALWYYIACENMNLEIESRHLTKIRKYAEAPEECIAKVQRVKYNLSVGMEIIKTFRGIEFKVMVAGDNDYIHKGKHYSTLSAAAKEICGIKVSGPDFFGLNNKKVKEANNGQN